MMMQPLLSLPPRKKGITMSKHFSGAGLLIQLFDMTKVLLRVAHFFFRCCCHCCCCKCVRMLSVQWFNKSSFSIVTFSLVVRFLSAAIRMRDICAFAIFAVKHILFPLLSLSLSPPPLLLLLTEIVITFGRLVS